MVTWGLGEDEMKGRHGLLTTILYKWNYYHTHRHTKIPSKDPELIAFNAKPTALSLSCYNDIRHIHLGERRAGNKFAMSTTGIFWSCFEISGDLSG